MRYLSFFFCLVWLTLVVPSAAEVPPATVTGPIVASVEPGDPSRDFVFSTSAIELRKHGYV